MNRTGVRMRAIVQRNITALVVVLVIVAMAGGWLTYSAYGTTTTAADKQSSEPWESTGSFAHNATVTEDNSAYSQETTLDNRTTYPTTIASQFQGTYTYTYQTPTDGELDGEITLELVQQSVKGQGEDQTVLWETTEPITEESFTSLEPGETVDVPFNVNMSAVANQTDQINDEFGNPSGDDRVTVVATVNTKGEVTGDSVAMTEEHELVMTLDRSLYRVEPPTEMSEQYGETNDSVVTASSPSMPQRLGGPLALVGAVTGLGLLGVSKTTGRLTISESERAWLAFHDDREDFDEWITTIRLPDEAFERPRAEADSLANLVDLAIDTDNSVIEDPNKDEYYVLHEDYLYLYSKPDLDEQPPTESTTGSENPESPAAADKTAVSSASED